MITRSITGDEESIVLDPTDITKIQGVMSFIIKDNSSPVYYAIAPFSDTNSGLLKEAGRGVIFSSAHDVYFKVKPLGSDIDAVYVIQCRSIGL